MSVVTDEKLIEKLKAKRGQQRAEASPSNEVADEALRERLFKKREEAVKKQPTSPEESVDSVDPEGNVFTDFYRTVASVVSGAVAEPISGFAGIATMLGTGGDVDRAVKAIEGTQEFLTYTPETKGAQANLQALGEALAPVAEGLETVSSAAGDTVYEWTGSPEAAAVAYSLPTVALDLIGLKGAGKVRKLDNATLAKAQKEMLKDPNLKVHEAVAEVKLNDKGQLVEDKMGKRLVENGISRRDTSLITNSSSSTKRQMRKMADTFEKGKGNALEATVQKTTTQIGQSVTNRLQGLSSKRKGLGKRLDNVVNGPLGQKPVNVGEALKELNGLLGEIGIKPIYNNKGKLRLPDGWFKDTIYETKQMSSVRRAIEDVYKTFDVTTNLGATTLKRSHTLKKNLDEMIDAGKLTEAGVTPQMTRRIQNVRQSVNNTLNQFPEYGGINTDLSLIIDAMAPFGKYLDSGQKWADARVSSIVGSAMKDLGSDSSSAAALNADLAKLNNVASQLGLSFGDNPAALVAFRQILLDNFNTVPQTPKANTRASMASFAVSGALGNTFGAAHDANALARAGLGNRKAKKLAEQNIRAFNLIKIATAK
jgi:hypothetical protein